MVDYKKNFYLEGIFLLLQVNKNNYLGIEKKQIN